MRCFNSTKCIKLISFRMQLKFPETVQKINLLYYSIIVIVLGTPLWWYTTDTYRATLPHSQITGLTEYKTLFSIPVGVCFDPTGKCLLKEMCSLISSAEHSQFSHFERHGHKSTLIDAQ